MKTKFISLFFVLAVFSTVLLAQNTCEAPLTIENLPYSSTGLNTAGKGDDYGPDDACGSAAMECEDIVFEFTPAEDMHVRVALSNTAITSSLPFGITSKIGLFVIEGCPNVPESVCVASNDSEQANPQLPMIALTGGLTYYIVVSSEVQLVLIQELQTTVTFNILVEQIFDTDAQVLSISPIASGCGLEEVEISANIKNSGVNPIENFHIGFQVNSNDPVVETFINSIAAGNEQLFTFAQLADVSETGTHIIKVFVMVDGDQNEMNDNLVTSVTNTPVIDVLPNTADFEDNDGYFYSAGTGSSWQHGMPDVESTELIINEAFSGDNIWATNLSGNANTNENSYLYSPCYDVSSLLTPTLRFQLWAEPGILPGFGGTLNLHASADGGNTYPINIATWDASTGGWTQQEFALTELQGESNVRFRFTYQSGFIASEGVAIDDFTVKDEILADATPGVLSLPVGACGLSDEEYVKLYILNHGALPVENIMMTYSLDGGETWLDTPELLEGPIEAHDSISFTFDQRADLSIPGSYMLVVKCMLDDDEETSNDERSYEIINTMVIDEIPYLESFETENHGWIGSNGSSWARGIPADTLVINHAYDGEYVMATNPGGNANMMEVSELISPCFDVSAENAVRVSMKVWYETGLVPATINIEGSNDGGNSWFSIEQGLTGSSGGWVTKSYFITEFTGQNACKIRIAYNGQILPAEGIAIDYISIEPVFAKDLGISGYNGPASSCALGNNEHFSVEVTNYGSDPQWSFQVQYSMDGGNNWVIHYFQGTLQPQAVSTVTFNQAVDLSAVGEYDVIFRTLTTGDENTDNDVLEVTVVNTGSINTFPYSENFETGSSDWFSYGENSSFALGTPAGTIINQAGEGSNSWVTNLTGNHNANEISYLQGPCFDFSNMTNPMIKARVIYETSMFMAGFYVEYSLNNGQSWDTLPSGGALGTWYSAGLIPGFGSSWNGSSNGWINVATNMPALAGQSDVMIRFSFNSGSFAFMQTEGVGIDDIQIYECDNLPSAGFDYTIDGTTVQFNSYSVGDNDVVSWNFGDNEFLPSTSNEPNPSFSYPAEGSYLVTLTVSNQCGSDVSQQYIDVFTGMGANYNNSVKLFPNPAKNAIKIIAADPIQGIGIYNIQGKLIWSDEPENTFTEISIEHLPQGLYFTKIITNSATVTKSLIIE